MHRFFYIFLSLALGSMVFAGASSPAHATKPCTAPDDAAFAQIVADAPLILRGRIAESHAGTRQDGEKWTDIDVVEIFRGGLQGNGLRGLRIDGWAAQDMPLFNYADGSELIFLLKPAPSGNNMALSNADWISCVPALMPRLPDGSYAVNTQKMRLETFLRDYIRTVPGLKELSTSTVAVRAGKIYIQAMKGPTRPVMRLGDPESPDVPAPNVTVEILNKDGRRAGFAMTDQTGKVDFTLPPGDYTIMAHPQSNIARAENTPMDITLRPGTEERVELDIDTGIR